MTLQTLQPSAKNKGLVGSHGQIIHHSKDKAKVKSSSGSNKIHVFEDKSSTISQKKNKMEERGVQTEPVESDEVKSLTTGNSYIIISPLCRLPIK